MKKGDIVKIRMDLWIGNLYGEPMIKFTGDMAEERGRLGFVTDVIEAEKAVKVNGWWWHESMVELVHSARQWVSVEERLPEESGHYLVFTKLTKTLTSYDYSAKYKAFNMRDDIDAEKLTSCEVEVTHWMPLPEPPEVQNESA